MTTKPLIAGLAVAALLFTSSTVRAADHLDAPSLTGNGSTDVNDLYAFQSPNNPDNSVLVMTVNPFSGVMSPQTFDPQVDYEFNIDYNGDAVSDLAYTAEFSPEAGGTQAYTVTRTEGATTTPYAGTTGADSTVGDVMLHAGQFEDPFFFDFSGFMEVQAGTGSFTGDDFFEGADVSAIVLEVPSSDLQESAGNTNIGVWARTLDGTTGDQIDRIGRPSINTALISPDSEKEAYNEGAPVDDPADFGSIVQSSIESLNGGDTTAAMNLTDTLLPDVLTFDTSSDAGFLNGRQLTDDVIDAELDLITGGAITTDMVDSNDATFPGTFPYLATANIPEPASAALLLPASLYFLRRRRS